MDLQLQILLEDLFLLEGQDFRLARSIQQVPDSLELRLVLLAPGFLEDLVDHQLQVLLEDQFLPVGHQLQVLLVDLFLPVDHQLQVLLEVQDFHLARLLQQVPDSLELRLVLVGLQAQEFQRQESNKQKGRR